MPVREADNPPLDSGALRELLRPTRDALALRWWIDGFQGADRGPTKRSARRNLFGGTANPDPSDDVLIRRRGAPATGWARSWFRSSLGRNTP